MTDSDGSVVPDDGDEKAVADAMTAEFDDVATWTERIVEQLGPEYAIPAGCRGSASPAHLAWFAEAMAVTPGSRFLDAGAGLGGPAGWLSEHFAVRPVLAEPMTGAATSAGRLFGLPTVAAWSQSLPFRDGSFDAAWCLGVLCTTTEKGAILAELRRVLAPGGRLGLLVFTVDGPQPTDAPDGNEFPTVDGIGTLLAGAGFTVREQIGGTELAAPPAAWQDRIDVVERALAARYGDRPAFAQAAEQQRRMGALLAAGTVTPVLVHAVTG